ncbi:hypothetical protein CerSpe_166970 [Prunus speciosa]
MTPPSANYPHLSLQPHPHEPRNPDPISSPHPDLFSSPYPSSSQISYPHTDLFSPPLSNFFFHHPLRSKAIWPIPATRSASDASDTFLYNPSDLTSWIDSLLSEFNHQPLISIPSDLDFLDAIMEGKKSGGIEGNKLEGRISGRGKKFNILFI